MVLFHNELVRLTVVILLTTARTTPASADDDFASGQLTAADVDDNLNFAWYLKYQERRIAKDKEYGDPILPAPVLSDRIPIEVYDTSGEPFSCAEIQVQGKTIPTSTNGKLSLFPSIDGLVVVDSEPLQVFAKPPGGTCPEDCASASIGTDAVMSARTTDLNETESKGNNNTDEFEPAMDAVRMTISSQAAAVPTKLDLALLIDTTGSMCDEIDYLKVELGEILREAASNVDVQLAYIAFKSANDTPYDVRVSPFGSTANFADELDTEECSGGGQGELVNKALEAASQLEWRGGNVARLVLIVGDEPPHGNLKRDMQEAFDAAVDLRHLGVRVYGLAASGAEASAEYLFRLISLITGTRYLWLTDDSGIGDAHADPEVLCYQVTHLDKLLYRVIRSELTGKRVEADPSHIFRETGQQEAGICLYDLNADNGSDEGNDELDAQRSPYSGASRPTSFPFLLCTGSLFIILAWIG